MLLDLPRLLDAAADLMFTTGTDYSIGTSERMRSDLRELGELFEEYQIENLDQLRSLFKAMSGI